MILARLFVTHLPCIHLHATPPHYFAVGGGVYIDIEQIIWPLRLTSYLTPLTYAFPAFLYHLIGDAPDFQGAVLCDEGTADCALGFKCSIGTSDEACIGVTGQQALQSLHAQYSTAVDVNDIFWKHIGIIFALSASIRAIYSVVLCLESRHRVELSLPSSAVPHAPLECTDAVQKIATDSDGDAQGSQGAAGRALFGSSLTGRDFPQLVISNLSLQLEKQTDETEEKFLLKDVSASCQAGEVLSIMGPSGAGKTTLLNVLTCETTSQPIESITGAVTLNGNTLDAELFREQGAYVLQQDVGLFVFLSCREHVFFAAALHQGAMSLSQVEELTDDLLVKTGLYSCKNTRAGSSAFPGLSGGQRRRLSMAVALSKAPSTLIVDEPTTGLDDAAAASVMKLLRDVAEMAKIVVACTIHQPSANVFGHMRSLLILTQGCTAYYGQASGVIEYVEAFGKPVPSGVSIAEHILNLVNADFASDDEVIVLLDAWCKRAPSLVPPIATSLPPPSTRPPNSRVFVVLCGKMGRILLRDVGFVWVKLGTLLVLSILYGLYAVFVRDREQEDVNTLYFAADFFMSNILFVGLPSLYGYTERWPAFQREISQGMYGPVMYWTVSTGLGALVNLGVIANVLPLGLLMNVPASSYLGLYVLCYAFILFCDAYIEMFSLLSLQASILLIGLFGVHIGFSAGVYLDWPNIIWPFRVFAYIFPGRYMYVSVLHLCFGGENDRWSGADRHLITSEDLDIRNGHSHADLADPLINQSTFVCPGSSSICFGDNGRDVLNALSVNANPSAASITLALPQNIHPSPPQT